MARIARVILPNYPHHVIQRGNNRQAIFHDDLDRKEYLFLVQRFKEDSGCKLFAYCLMNNHVHLLITPGSSDQLSKFMQKLSLRYTQYYNHKYNKTGRLWECRFYSAPVDKENYLLSVCQYIEQNPVKAKIVEKAHDYDWSSCRYRHKGNAPAFLDELFKDDTAREEYSNLIKNALTEDVYTMIYKSTNSGMPIGSVKFLETITGLIGRDLRKRPRGRPKKIDNQE